MNGIDELIKLILSKVQHPISLGIVKNVDEESGLCEVERDDLPTLYNVRLNAVVSGSQMFMQIPSLESFVIVAEISDGGQAVIMTSSIDKIIAQVSDDISMVMDKNGIVFNDGKLGGLIKIDDLINRLNTVEKDLNTIKTSIKSWVPVVQDGGASLKTRLMSWCNSTIQITTKADIENERVKQ